MTTLLDQCHEVLHDILSYVDPEDLGRLPQTCSALRNYIVNNRLLWKKVYLTHYDELLLDPAEPEPQWETDLKSFTKTSHILKSRSEHVKNENLEYVATNIIKLIESSAPGHEASKNIQRLTQRFNSSLDNLDNFVMNSNLFDVVRESKPSKSPALSNKLAHIHCLVGSSYDYLAYKNNAFEQYVAAMKPTRTIKLKAYPYARAQVYDMRLCTPKTRWGPWAQDGSLNVDWERVECLMIDLAFNVNRFCEQSTMVLDVPWKEPFKGVQKGSYIDTFPRETSQKDEENKDEEQSSDPGLDVLKEQPAPPLDAQDPYGVTGTWMRMVCFLDYGDFYYANFSSSHQPISERRPPIHNDEATRLILMRLHVTRIEHVPNSRLPVVHFSGTSRSMHPGWDPNASSRIQGTVSLTPEGQVRWSTLSLFQGEARWKSEAVQIGGPRSARGVIGSWFEKDMDAHGPMGPTAMFKLSDRTEKDNSLTWRRSPRGVRLSFDGPEVNITDGYVDPVPDEDSQDEAEDADWYPMDEHDIDDEEDDEIDPDFLIGRLMS